MGVSAARPREHLTRRQTHRNSAANNSPCDSCYDAAFMNEGLQDLLQIYGSVVYSCGTSGIAAGSFGPSAAMLQSCPALPRVNVNLVLLPDSTVFMSGARINAELGREPLLRQPVDLTVHLQLVP